VAINEVKHNSDLFTSPRGFEVKEPKKINSSAKQKKYALI
jgi:hypothetical protein